MVDRACVPRLPGLLSFVLCVLAAVSAPAVPLDGVPIGMSHLNVENAEFVGSGDAVTYLVIDLRAAGGGSFAFGYRHEGRDTALDMLESFAAAGVLQIAYEDFSFGPAVRGIGYPREEQADVFPGAFDGPRSWFLWEGIHEGAQVEWSPASVGINGVEFGNIEPTVFLAADGFYGLATWTADDYPGPSPLAPLPGDFDSDGVVDGHDLLDALLGFGTATGPTLAAGDADRDGDVDRADISLWRENVGAGLPSSAGPASASLSGTGANGVAAPEPSSLLLLLAVLTAFAAWRTCRPLTNG